MIIMIVVVLGIVGLFALIVSGVRSPRKGANLSRAGLMELQNLLEPDRKVEILRETETKKDLLVTLDDKGGT